MPCDLAALATEVEQRRPSKGPGEKVAIPACGAAARSATHRTPSFEAFQRNPEYTPGSGPELWTDREMLLLSFFVDRNNRGERDAIGALNWYAIHPTSLGMFNDQISGDNKGHAELLFEAERDRRAGVGGRFVAVFGNGNAGDVSGNMTLDVLGRKQVHKPLDGDLPAAPLTIFPTARQPGSSGHDLRAMQARGEQQFKHALMLWDATLTEAGLRSPAPEDDAFNPRRSIGWRSAGPLTPLMDQQLHALPRPPAAGSIRSAPAHSARADRPSAADGVARDQHPDDEAAYPSGGVGRRGGFDLHG